MHSVALARFVQGEQRVGLGRRAARPGLGDIRARLRYPGDARVGGVRGGGGYGAGGSVRGARGWSRPPRGVAQDATPRVSRRDAHA